MLFLRSALSLPDVGPQYKNYIVYYSSTGDVDKYEFPMNDHDFGTNWYFKPTATKSSDNKTATVNPSTRAADSARITQSFSQVPLDKDWTNMEIECRNADKKISDGLCYIDFIIQTETGPHYQYPHTSLGSTYLLQLAAPANHSSFFNLYLQNSNANEPRTFLTPKVRLLSYQYNAVDVRTQEVNGMKKVTATIPQNGEVINLHSIHLKNHFLTEGNFNYDNYAELPIIANATHIVGIDLLDRTNLSLWKSNGNFFHMRIKARKQFEISFYVIEANTSSYKEALEVWYSKFPEIYQSQEYGVGAWVPFMWKGNYDFPGLKDDFLAKFWWGSAAVKGYNEFRYVEPTLLHINIPFIENTEEMEASLRTCRDQPLTGDTQQDRSITLQKKKCELMIKYGFRDQSGNLYTIWREQAAWNDGIAGRIQMVDEAFEFYFNDTIEALNKPDTPYKGIGLDSFTSYAKAYSGAFPDFPYDLVEDDGTLFLPAHVALYSALLSTGSKSNMANTAALNPQFVPFIDHVGYECQTFPGKFQFTTWTQRAWRTLRYAVGSRAISMLENTHRELSFPYAETYFSVCAAYGIIPSYFSYDASTNNFWNNHVDLERMRPRYKRWGPYLMEALNESIYYPNNMGLVETDAEVTMWCKGEQCYLMVLVVEDTEIKLKNGKTGFCYFQAEETKCSSSGSTIKLSTNEPYRTVIIKLGKQELGGGIITSAVLSSVLLVLGVTCSVILFLKNGKQTTKTTTDKSIET